MAGRGRRRRAPGCGISLHVRDLPIYDYREALRPPTRFLPMEEEEYEEEGRWQFVVGSS